MKSLGIVVAAFAIVTAAGAAASSDTYREATAYGYRTAARILNGPLATDGTRNVHVRVSVSAPSKPARDATVLLVVPTGAEARFASLKEYGRIPITLLKTPYDLSPLVRVTVAFEGGRNWEFVDSIVHLAGGRLVQIRQYRLSPDKPDHAQRMAGPLSFRQIVKLESRDQDMERVGGTTTWHSAMYRVTTPAGEEQILSTSTPIRESGVDSGSPDPHPTPFLDPPIDGRPFCLWRAKSDGACAGSPYYAPC